MWFAMLVYCARVATIEHGSIAVFVEMLLVWIVPFTSLVDYSSVTDVIGSAMVV